MGLLMSFFQFHKYLCQKVLGARRIDEDNSVTGLGAKEGVRRPNFAFLLHPKVSLGNFVGLFLLARGKRLHIEVGKVGRSAVGVLRQCLVKPSCEREAVFQHFLKAVAAEVPENHP